MAVSAGQHLKEVTIMTYIPVVNTGLVLFPIDIARANLMKFRRTKNPMALSDEDFQKQFDANSLPWTYQDIEVFTDACDRVEALDSFEGRIETFNPGATTNAPLCEDVKGLVYLPLLKKPNHFAASYESTDEMLTELKNTFGLVLPVDFDYGQHLCDITGVTSV